MKRFVPTLFVALLGVVLVASANAADKAAGQAKAKEVCAACHGIDGNSTDVNNPRLAGQWPDYLAKALRDYQSGDRNHVVMSGFAKALTKQDIENLAAYYSSQKPVLSHKY
jgi:cytochrome c553